MNTGVPESDIQHAEPDFVGMNHIGYHAMALGNHEFDNPLAVLRKQEELALFPFLSANVLERKTGKSAFQTHASFIFNGIKVVVVGLTTEDTRKMVNPENVAELDFLPAVERAKAIGETLREEADVMIALTHAGHYPEGENGSNAPGDVAIAQATDAYDLVVGGHSHSKLDSPDVVMGTPIVQAGEWGKWVGRVDLSVKNGEVSLVSHRLYPVNLKKKVEVDGESKRVFIESEIGQDPSLYAILEEYQEKGSEGLSQVVGEVVGNLVGERFIVRSSETNLGNLIAASQAQKVGADLAIMNSGGIRTDIEEGSITYKDILQVQPFGNTVCIVDLNAEELKSYLEAALQMSPGSGAFPQFAGVEITADENLAITRLKVGSEPVEEGRTYRLAVNNFMAAGGDGYPVLTSHPTFVNTGYVDADVLKEFIQNNSPIIADLFAPENDVIIQ